jgi:hypothetical protein
VAVLQLGLRQSVQRVLSKTPDPPGRKAVHDGMERLRWL